eukprot:GFUD01126238.1.p1 GENE.GFUD01126238.1~~GFUD01126238.1.p1  ORF type:complete len:366 (+),score=135.50 GFUD01126238.1:54-1151(+)
MMASTSTCPQVMSTSTSTLVIIERVEDYGKANAKNATLPRKRAGRGNVVAELPPLPMESELFTPPVDKGDKGEKSIKLLGEKLLAMMPKEGTLEVEVDKMARELKVGIQRVYNICNVLEGLRLMERHGKKVWKWQGKERLLPGLMLLKQMSEQQDMKGQVDMARKVLAKELPEDSISNKAIKKYNLVMMTQKMMMMFLVLPQPRTLPLTVASIIIHGPGLSRASLQRLGDIGMILQSVGLLAKVRVKKEGDIKGTIAYQYVGLKIPTMPILDVEPKDVEMEEELAAVSNIIVENGRQMVESTEERAMSRGGEEGARNREIVEMSELGVMAGGGEEETSCSNSQEKEEEVQELPLNREGEVEVLDI